MAVTEIVLPPIEPGDVVGVIAPSSAPPNDRRHEDGVAALQRAGYRVIDSGREAEPVGYLAGTDDVRARLLNSTFANPDIKAVFCTRGGYGILRILDRIDFDALRRHPKLVVGYSDITALQCAILAVNGIPGLSASMVAVDWPDLTEAERETHVRILAGKANQGLYGPEGVSLVPLKHGNAAGVLFGGNLSMIVRLLGSPYLPPLEDKILFVEEVGEAPYRIDAMFAQLHLAGVLKSIRGLVLGRFTDAKPPDGQPSLEVEDVLNHYARLCVGPVASGLPYGHVREKIPMPIGVAGTLSVDQGESRLKATQQVTSATPS